VGTAAAISNHREVSIEVRADRGRGPCHPLWNWFGHDEPNYTYGSDGKKLLRELAGLSATAPHIRTHNLLTTGDGAPSLKWGSTNAYTEDAAGNPIYNWTILDRIFDTYVEAGVRPFIEVGFTPQALSDDAGPYRHSWSLEDPHSTITAGWALPPNDLGRWSDLIEAWAAHLVERYGRQAVASWPWEIWNEPDGLYWTGTIGEFCATYDAAARAIKTVLPEARIGGPHTCGPFENDAARTFLSEFLRHVVDAGSPLDFIAFHAKGQPSVEDGHVRMGLRKQLRDIETGLAVVREFPSLAGLPVIIGESDPEGCAACSARVYPHNAYRNGPLYGAYVVETMMRTYELARRVGILIEGAVTWAFVFEDQPFFDGFRSLATNGIDKAVLNTFRLLGKLGGEWVETRSSHALALDDILDTGVREAPDINACATRDEKGVTALVWNYHDDDLPADGAAAVTLTVQGLPDLPVRCEQFRMDATHANAYGVWRQMGCPQRIEADDYAKIEQASKLASVETGERRPTDGVLTFAFDLPRQGVTAWRLEW